MSRTFNITADCKPSLHYMVDITDRLEQIKKMIDAGQYFTINRARQYGKTTILRALAKYLVQDYVVVSLDFLSQLRGYYIDRDVTPAFQSVILAGVYDIKNIKRKIRSDEDHKNNSPWNMREGNEENESLLSFDDCPRDHKEPAPYDIAAKFRVDMSFSQKDITGMLEEYEKDYHTGMDIDTMAGLIYDYTGRLSLPGVVAVQMY